MHVIIQLKLRNIINKCVCNFCLILNLCLLLIDSSYDIRVRNPWSRRPGLIYFNLPRNCLSHLNKTFAWHVYLNDVQKYRTNVTEKLYQFEEKKIDQTLFYKT